MKKLILIIFCFLACSCVSSKARINQSIAAGNIWHAANAIEKGADPSIILPRIKSQAELIWKTNNHKMRGIDDGNN